MPLVGFQTLESRELKLCSWLGIPGLKKSQKGGMNDIYIHGRGNILFPRDLEWAQLRRLAHHGIYHLYKEPKVLVHDPQAFDD